MNNLKNEIKNYYDELQQTFKNLKSNNDNNTIIENKIDIIVESIIKLKENMEYLDSRLKI